MFVTSEAQAQAIALKLQKRFPSRITIDKARDMATVMYGYTGWSHFINSPHEPLSLFDDEVEPSERKIRANEQAEALTRFGLMLRAAAVFVRDIKPTTRTKEHVEYVREIKKQEELRSRIERYKAEAIAASNEKLEKSFASIAAAYEEGDFDKALRRFATLMQSEQTFPAEPLISILEKYADVDPRALHNIAVVLLSFENNEEKTAKAKRLLQYQIEKFPDDPKRGMVISTLGDIENGQHTGPVNVKVALALYKQASEMGVAPAAMNAGLIYDRHPDLRNAKSAEYYYELAGEYGMPEGITNLALMKAKLGTATASEVTAMLIRASDEGDEYASNMLAQALGKRSRGSPHW